MKLVVLSRALVCMLVLLGVVGTLSAGVITINSDTNPADESNNGGPGGVPGVDQFIPVSPVWAPNGVGYSWVSYANTGCDTFDPVTGHCTEQVSPPGPSGPITGPGAVAPTAVFYKTFTLPDAFNTGTIMVWADDTARVWLDTGTVNTGDGSGGMMLIEANPNAGGNCANAPIGCLPGMDAVFTFGGSGLTVGAGTYTLVIDAYQLAGGSPFGVMYAGSIDSEPSSSTPEPASYLLLGLGLAGIAILVPRRKRS
jgi:hypothetical protein